MHVDEDFAKLAILILTRAQIDLVTSNNRFLSVTFTALRHLFAVGFDDLFDDHLFDDFLCNNSRFFGDVTALEDVHRVIIVLNQSRSQWLAQFRSVAIQRIGFNTQGPAQLIGFLAVLDGRIVGHVDCLGDRARDERLRRSHHVDVAIDGQETLALLAAWIGTIKDAEVLVFEVRRAFQRHRTTHMIVRRVDIRFGISQVLEQIERRIVQLFSWDAKDTGAELFAQRPLVEHKANVESRGKRAFNLRQFICPKPVADQRRGINARRVTDRGMTNRI